jgi:hypothetical protein
MNLSATTTASRRLAIWRARSRKTHRKSRFTRESRFFVICHKLLGGLRGSFLANKLKMIVESACLASEMIAATLIIAFFHCSYITEI